MEDSDTVTFKRAIIEQVENGDNDSEYAAAPIGACNSDPDQIDNDYHRSSFETRVDSPDNCNNHSDIMERIEKYMTDLKNEVSNGMQQVRLEMGEFRDQLHVLHEQITERNDSNNSQNASNGSRLALRRGLTDQVWEDHMRRPRYSEQNGHGDNNFRVYDQHRLANSSTPNPITSFSNRMKVKPQTYDGSDDLEEYLTQFNLVAELNGWDYESKSLFLASSMVGGTRALLCELDASQRKDYQSIVNALQNRFGSANRAEIYRSKLQGKMLGKNETIPELAQSVRKLTQKAYPSASSEVVELLAMDYFIDALPDVDLRLRLREVGPKTIAEAETIAVRLDAHKVADKSRAKSVRAVVSEQNSSEKKIDELSNQLTTLLKDMQDLKHKFENRPRTAPNEVGNRNWNQPRNRPFQRARMAQGDNNDTRQGNGQRSRSGAAPRQ